MNDQCPAKPVLWSFFFSLLLLLLVAKETQAQSLPDTTQAFLKWEIGADMSWLLLPGGRYSLFNRRDALPGDNRPYDGAFSLMLRRHSPGGRAWRAKLGVNADMAGSVLEQGGTRSEWFSAGLGHEWQKTMGNFVPYAGIDTHINLYRQLEEVDLGVFKTWDVSLGTAPFVGVAYRIGQRLTFSAESYFVFQHNWRRSELMDIAQQAPARNTMLRNRSFSAMLIPIRFLMLSYRF